MIPKMTRAQHNFIADMIGPKVGWPSCLHDVADELQKTNPLFNRKKFIERATAAWERQNEPPKFEDEIPY